jgi:hypothetical protein
MMVDDASIADLLKAYQEVLTDEEKNYYHLLSMERTH